MASQGHSGDSEAFQGALGVPGEGLRVVLGRLTVNPNTSFEIHLNALKFLRPFQKRKPSNSCSVLQVVILYSIAR